MRRRHLCERGQRIDAVLSRHARIACAALVEEELIGHQASIRSRPSRTVKMSLEGTDCPQYDLRSCDLRRSNTCPLSSFSLVQKRVRVIVDCRWAHHACHHPSSLVP
jgi:hypothetical protein